LMGVEPRTRHERKPPKSQAVLRRAPALAAVAAPPV
jgi:hypothetical protein